MFRSSKQFIRFIEIVDQTEQYAETYSPVPQVCLTLHENALFRVRQAILVSNC